MVSQQPNDSLAGDKQQERLALQSAFQTALGAVEASDIYSLESSQLVSQMNHEGFASHDIEPPAEDGLYLDSSLLGQLETEGQAPTHLEFEVLPLQSIGRENSRNMVFFGNIFLQDATDSGRTINVAVKPIRGPQNQRAAMHEYAMNEFLAIKGIEGPTQIGMLRAGDDIYLLSEFAPHIITLDSLDWANFDEAEQAHAITRGIESLAILHSNGLFHGDAELKNLTMQPERTSHWILDMEFAVSLADTPENVSRPNGVIAKATQDLKRFAKSLRDHGVIPKGLSALEGFQKDVEIVLEPYRKLIEDSPQDSPFVEQLRIHYPVIQELFYREAIGEDINVSRVMQTMSALATQTS